MKIIRRFLVIVAIVFATILCGLSIKWMFGNAALPVMGVCYMMVLYGIFLNTSVKLL